jgi:hypothetical protein
MIATVFGAVPLAVLTQFAMGHQQQHQITTHKIVLDWLVHTKRRTSL